MLNNECMYPTASSLPHGCWQSHLTALLIILIHLFTGTNLTIVGYGLYYHHGAYNFSVVPRKVQVTLLTLSECNEILCVDGCSRPRITRFVLYSSPCKSRPGPCRGDAGAPAFLELNGTRTQIGHATGTSGQEQGIYGGRNGTLGFMYVDYAPFVG